MRKSVRIKGAAIVVLLLATLCIWYAAIQEDHRGFLAVSFLDIGQGDSIFIQVPSGRQVLVDGGANTSVLRQLSRVMPWYDRSIDVVISTHPDADHIGGLIDVLARYKVDTVVHSSVEGDTKTFAAFNRAMVDEHAQEVVAIRGQIVDLGRGAYLQILSPDRPVPHEDTNDGCVVARLVYGTTAFMLSCDAPQSIENYLVALGTSTLKSNVLKAGHHGSKTSSSPLFLGYVAPEYGVFSRGCDNSYGHPAPEIVARFAQFGIPTFDTCKDGTVTFVSDGKTVRRN
ncbi:MBL fold metallo-hydrolase [Candidatus Kaiserbacteria bacterium]|nr:MBL fold metallo-hydrolase [Candidatus Kaiserbacteria bacterium]